MGEYASDGEPQYRLIKTMEYVEECGPVLTYGICCREVIEENNMKKIKNHCVPNISTKPAMVKEILCALRENDVSPLHFKDVIEDHLP